MGSNFFHELLRPLPTHTELPHIFEKKVITLIGILALTSQKTFRMFPLKNLIHLFKKSQQLPTYYLA